MRSKVFIGVRRRTIREGVVLICLLCIVFSGGFGALPFAMMVATSVFRRTYLYWTLRENSVECRVALNTSGTKMNIDPVAKIYIAEVPSTHKIVGFINWPAHSGVGLIQLGSPKSLLAVDSGRIYRLVRTSADSRK
jgi:hypothetical protein